MALLANMADYSKLLAGDDRARYLMLSPVAITAAVKIIHSVRAYKRQHDLRQLRDEYSQRMKAEVDELLENCKKKISEGRSNEITSLSFEDLQHKLQTGELSCVEVLWAYQLKAVTENVTLNFIAQPIREAEEIASALDALDVAAKQKLPLFGIPVSVKESCNLDGYTSTIGISQLLTNKTNQTQVLVQSLKDAGAVPFIRTNIVQTMMSLGAHNPIYGQTRNPKDPKRSPGGSSSGEGSAIGSGASILGLGTDIWGSVRVPAAWCGIYSLKPTAGRLSSLHLTPALAGQTAVKGTAGFMSRDMPSLIAAIKVVSTDIQFDLDPTVPRIHFNDEDFNSTKPLTVGYIHHCPPIAATESAKNAVTKVTQALTLKGHKVVEWELPAFDKVPGELQTRALFGDGGEQLARKL